MPLKVHKDETLAGLVFVYFVAIVMRSLLKQMACLAKLLEKSSM